MISIVQAKKNPTQQAELDVAEPAAQGCWDAYNPGRLFGAPGLKSPDCTVVPRLVLARPAPAPRCTTVAPGVPRHRAANSRWFRTCLYYSFDSVRAPAARVAAVLDAAAHHRPPTEEAIVPIVLRNLAYCFKDDPSPLIGFLDHHGIPITALTPELQPKTEVPCGARSTGCAYSVCPARHIDALKILAPRTLCVNGGFYVAQSRDCVVAMQRFSTAQHDRADRRRRAEGRLPRATRYPYTTSVAERRDPIFPWECITPCCYMPSHPFFNTPHEHIESAF